MPNTRFDQQRSEWDSSYHQSFEAAVAAFYDGDIDGNELQERLQQLGADHTEVMGFIDDNEARDRYHKALSIAEGIDPNNKKALTQARIDRMRGPGPVKDF